MAGFEFRGIEWNGEWQKIFWHSGVLLVCGIGLGLAASETSLWWWGWLAIAPLWFVLIQPKTTLWTAILNSGWWGVGYYGATLSWLVGMHPMMWLGLSWLTSLGIAVLCWVLATLWGTGMIVLWGMGLWAFRRGERDQSGAAIATCLLWGVVLWCTLEHFWAWGPLWWGGLSLTQSPGNLALLQWLRLSGSTTIVAALVLVNGLLAEGIYLWAKKRNGWVCIGLAVGFALCLQGFGAFRSQMPMVTDERDKIEVGIVQGNIPNDIKLTAKGIRRAITHYTQGYGQAVTEGVDFVLTPEGAIPFYEEQIKETRLWDAIARFKFPAVVGGFAKTETGYTNNLFWVDEQAGEPQITARYAKVNLVPIGEYIPLESLLGGLISRLSPLDEHQQFGDRNQRFETPWGLAIVGICYDSAFTEHFRRQAAQGGEFILTASNDAHYGAWMPRQHHGLDVMNAIATDRWAARATNTGYSAIVDSGGNTRWYSELNEFVTHTGAIYRNRTMTPYVRWGDWLWKCLLVGGAVVLGLRWWRR